MSTKNFIVGGIVGGIIDWLLGWLFYGIIFADKFPQPDETTNAMLFITCGCFAFGFFISFIFNKWADITTFGAGLKAGVIIGLFMSLIEGFFNLAEQASPNYEMFGLVLFIYIVTSGIVGGAVGAVSGKLG
ncbi:hypothetical protein [Hanstruepera flava]|uniref:hypothetical protein n=1 Tax=Hanstruepera flava TaxID=2930218 RepID=UPI0020293E01|nr:hypothetical protein [Hanstruepera flava]